MGPARAATSKLAALALVLRKWMGSRLAIVPILLIGSSPTWLFYNANQAQFGIDLQMAPILILLATYCSSLLASFFFGAAFLFSCMLYPTTLFYAGPFAYFFWITAREKIVQIAGVSFIGALIVLVAFLIYSQEPALLLHDPSTGSGIFRGGGGGITLNPFTIWQHTEVSLKDLFLRSTGYSFGIPSVEFGSWISRLSFLGVLFFALRGRSKDPFMLGICIGALFLFVLPQTVASWPGLRRASGILAVYYALAAWVWMRSPGLSIRGRVFAGLVLSLGLVGHFHTLSMNLNVSPAWLRQTNPEWFTTKGSPEASVRHWDEFSRGGGVLRCAPGCRYAEIFGAIAGRRQWSGSEAAPILIWDENSQRSREAHLSLWTSREWVQ